MQVDKKQCNDHLDSLEIVTRMSFIITILATKEGPTCLRQLLIANLSLLMTIHTLLRLPARAHSIVINDNLCYD